MSDTEGVIGTTAGLLSTGVMVYAASVPINALKNMDRKPKRRRNRRH